MPVGRTQLLQLTELSNRILHGEMPDEEREACIVEYSELLDVLVSKNKDTAHLGLEAEELEALLKNHSEVLARAETLKLKARESLRTLRQKGKAIMGYVDVLPKRISTINTRKV